MKAIRIAAVIVLFPVATLFADGVGGAFWGGQHNAYPWESEDSPIFSTTRDELDYVGGMGYGISRDGTVAGGFGVGYSASDEDGGGVSGGFGGFITGHRIVDRPVNLLGLLYVGVGGIRDSRTLESEARGGVFAVLVEGNLELSVPLMFFHPTFYAGYQVIASVGDGGLGEQFLSYSPTLGFRMLFGDQ